MAKETIITLKCPTCKKEIKADINFDNIVKTKMIELINKILNEVDEDNPLTKEA